MTDGPRIAVIGLDSVPANLLFNDLIDDVPNIRKLMERGMHGELASITPPITVPAWACAMTGKTPGQLGIYGFRNRKDNTYDGLTIATADAVEEPAVWDLIGRRGMRSLLVGVPPSYPPRPVEGWRIGCFLTPASNKGYTYPADLQVDVEEELGGADRYIFDIPNFREQGFDYVLDRLFKMTERRFQVARHLIKTKPWDYFHMVEMGTDRIQHVFWHFFDPNHRLYQSGNRYESAFADYYRFVDREVGSLLEVLPDDAITIVMSDHGARAMAGGICFNDWLVENGYLALSEPLDEVVPIGKAPIDWSRTVAWGDGGYYGRLFLNVKDREPNGVVEPSRYEDIRSELIAHLEAMKGPDGEPLGTKVFRPQDVYPDVRGIAPDLIVYFGDLEWRSVGSIGNSSVYTYENDTGPDGANHDKTGIFALANAPDQPMGTVEGLRLIDVGPTIMKLFGVEVPQGAVGRSFL
jgi:predicted AlkP superfamily phosphohydrolase/phosphomutase